VETPQGAFRPSSRSTPPFSLMLEAIIRLLDRSAQALRGVKVWWREPWTYYLDLEPYENYIMIAVLGAIIWIILLVWIPTLALWWQALLFV
jgi:hypothetical protein